MTKLKQSKWCGCPIRFLAGILGDQWSLLIIRDMMFFGKRRYGEFLQAGEGISTNILADRLARLEQSGVISKAPDPDNATRILYRLTPIGQDLLPVMLAAIEWSAKHDLKTEVPKAWQKRLRTDRKRFERELAIEIKTRSS